MARALLRFRKTDSAFWIQVSPCLALGAELRDLGVTEPIGFFLHTPWPSRAVISGVPHHRELIEAMLAYDLVGFQTEEDCENFLSTRNPISDYPCMTASSSRATAAPAPRYFRSASIPGSSRSWRRRRPPIRMSRGCGAA